jgi:oxygen-independent coproporphyrinogen-3 oxidase
MAATYERTAPCSTGRAFRSTRSRASRRPPSFATQSQDWKDAPYAGFGLGAHGYVNGERRSNRRDLDGYLADLAAGGSPVDWREPYAQDRRLDEALFLGLRVAEGVDLGTLGARYRADLMTRHAAAWERGTAAGLIAWDGARVRLTPGGACGRTSCSPS